MQNYYLDPFIGNWIFEKIRHLKNHFYKFDRKLEINKNWNYQFN